MLNILAFNTYLLGVL